MKKFKAILCAAVFALSMTFSASCSSGTQDSEIPMNEAKFSGDGNPIIAIGTVGFTDEMFLSKNKISRPKNIDVEIVDYSDGVDKDLSYKEKQKAIRQNIDNALISGNAPDIIIADSEEILRLNRLGILADLFELMERYDGIKKDDLTDCALEGLAIDGKMPALLENYYIRTAAAKTKFVPKEYENWTAAEAMEFYKNTADDRDFCKYQTDTALADYMLKLEGMSCVDINAGKCDFSGAFTEILDFCKNNRVIPDREADFASMSESDLEIYYREEENKGVNDSYLVYEIPINSFSSTLAASTYSYLNKEDLTFVGYPSENGCGAYVIPPNNTGLMAVCSQSSNKEAAWELLNKMISHRVRTETYMNSDVMGIPVFKSEWDYYYDLDEEYQSSINAYVYAYGSFDEKIKITSEYKDMLRDYILSIPVNPYTPQSIEYIIKEECDPVILDNRSAEEAASIMQNRIETYLSEKS